MKAKFEGSDLVQDPFSPLFFPKSIAVIGASDDPGKIGYCSLNALITGGFEGDIYPVNHNVSELLGLQVFPSVDAIPGTVDLAVFVVPSRLTPEFMEQCARKGVGGVVIQSGGFKETGSDSGAGLQEKTIAIANEAGIKIIGPNTVGMWNTQANLHASFMHINGLKKGNIAVVTQSGGVVGFLLHSMSRQKMGVSFAMGLGNRGNVCYADILKYLAQDNQTEVILLHLEGIDDPSTLMEAAKSVAKKKPIVAYKVGGEELNQIAFSHTGSLAGNSGIYSGAFKQAGIVEVTDCTEMIDVAKSLSLQSPMVGNKVAVLSPQAGPGLIAAHTCQRLGLSLASFKPETKRRLQLILGSLVGEVRNPMDLVGVAGDQMALEKVFQAVLEDDDVDGVLVSNLSDPSAPFSVYLPRAVHSVVSAFAESQKQMKPVVVCYDATSMAETMDVMGALEKQVPVYPLPERAAKALAGLFRYGDIKEKLSVDPA